MEGSVASRSSFSRTWVGLSAPNGLHGIHLDDASIDRLGAQGIGIAHRPASNARLASGICPVDRLEAAGCPVGLGVDGAAANDAGGMIDEMRLSLYLARLPDGRADACLPADVLL